MITSPSQLPRGNSSAGPSPRVSPRLSPRVSPSLSPRGSPSHAEVEKQEHGTQCSEYAESLQTQRARLGMLTPAELKQRALETLVGGVYPTRKIRNDNVKCESLGVQTEQPTVHSVAAGDGESAAVFATSRTHELSLALPTPQEFPCLTVSQLLEAQRRVEELLTRLETEILRAVEEDSRRAQANPESTPAPRSLGDAHDGAPTSLLSTSEWDLKMSQKVEKRLRCRYRDFTGEKPPTYWQRSKLDANASPLRDRSHMTRIESTANKYRNIVLTHTTEAKNSAQSSSGLDSGVGRTAAEGSPNEATRLAGEAEGNKKAKRHHKDKAK